MTWVCCWRTVEIEKYGNEVVVIVTLLRWTMKAEDPFVISAPELAGAVDRPAARDAAGALMAPASSLAGSLRQHLRARGGGDPSGLVTALMGSEPPAFGRDDDADDEQEDDLTPSPIRLLGTELTQPKNLSSEVSTSTAIDAYRGAAKDKTMRTSEILPRGTTVDLYGRIDRRLTADEKTALASWSPTLGGGISSGQGRFGGVTLSYGELDLSTDNGLCRWLMGGGPRLVRNVAGQKVEAGDRVEPVVILERTLQQVDGYLSDAESLSETEPDGDTRHNKKRSRKSWGNLEIKGSALRGVLRSRAAWIVTSIAVALHGDDSDVANAAKAMIDELFGSVTGRSQLRVRWAPFTDVGEVELTQIAIDRISGGPRPGSMFTEVTATGGKFQLTIEWMANEPPPPWVNLMLGAVLADIDGGWVGFGGRTTRGNGTFRVLGEDAQMPNLESVVGELKRRISAEGEA